MRDEQPAKAHNDRNVYILGAGFAAEAGLPLIKDFLNRMRDAAAWLEEQGGRERELEAIGRALEFRLRAAAAAHRVPLNVENVEELFSLASASGDPELAKAMPLAIAATLDYAQANAPLLSDQEYFPIGMFNVPNWTKPANWKSPPAHILSSVKSGQLKGQWYGCPPYEFYLGAMCSYFNNGRPDRRDTIITFNYDTLVEEVFRALKIAFNYGLPEDLIDFHDSAEWIKESYSDAKISILKLHGSMNWTALLPEEQERFRYRVSSTLFKSLADKGQLTEEKFLELMSRKALYVPLQIYANYEDLRTGTNLSRAPFLVPPTWRKPLSSFLATVWDSAVAALRTATRVIVLGYSVPSTDQHVKYLLAAGLQDNISLRKVFFVNPALAKEETKKQLDERLFGLFRRELFDQDIITPVPTDIRAFLAGQRKTGEESYLDRIGRPLKPPGYAGDTSPWTLMTPF
ncbi:MAG: SIR2 family protein [Candidatus Binataceae bacterium]